MDIRCLIVHGDSKLIINQVKDKISARNHYLKTYRNRVWDLLESFLVMIMISIPRKYNQIIDDLVVKGARLDLIHHERVSYRVKVLCKLFVLDTTNFLQVFNFDENIMNLLIDEIVAHIFGIQELLDWFQESNVIQLRSNVIPKGIISFECLLYYEYIHRSKMLAIQKQTLVELEVEPGKYIKVRSKCIEKEKEKLLHIYHEFPQVIAWIYDNLKIYDKDVIHHTIELMLDVKPYR